MVQKVARRVAEERNADLCDIYLYKMSGYRSERLVFLDESGTTGVLASVARAGRRWV